jgi:D-serine deaminase-like pyridoxal phosphate-dependent protein
MVDIYPEIERPTLVVDRERTKRNIAAMAGKAVSNGVRFRPHFKTHQSAVIGEWFREVGVESITVSSVDMATYFAANGWGDITIAFPVNIRQIKAINTLSKQISLNVLVESVAAVAGLRSWLDYEVGVWLKVDTGYCRTGIPWDDKEALLAVAGAVMRAGQLRLVGLLSHAGHTYKAGSAERVVEAFEESIERLIRARTSLGGPYQQLLLSVGDTPGCSLAPGFTGVDEVRPGNFVFYDLAQLSFGSCSEKQISVALACPVVAKHPSRKQIVIHGGAVHLSLDRLTTDGGKTVFGGVALPDAGGWTDMFEDSYVKSLSQEHGIVQAESALFETVDIGDLLMVIPVHSCLAADLMGSYLTLDRERIEMMSQSV